MTLRVVPPYSWPSLRAAPSNVWGGKLPSAPELKVGKLEPGVAAPPSHSFIWPRATASESFRKVAFADGGLWPKIDWRDPADLDLFIAVWCQLPKIVAEASAAQRPPCATSDFIVSLPPPAKARRLRLPTLPATRAHPRRHGTENGKAISNRLAAHPSECSREVSWMPINVAYCRSPRAGG